MAALGNASLVQTPKLALLCSRACSGGLIVRTLDAVRALRDTPWTVAGGFQSPTERECLEILLRAERPVIVCPARSVEGMRVPAAWQAAVAAGRYLLPPPGIRRFRGSSRSLRSQSPPRGRQPPQDDLDGRCARLDNAAQ